MIPLALIGSIFIGVILIVFVNRKPHFNPYILALACENSDSEKAVREYVKDKVTKLSTKSKTVTKDGIELNFEVRLKGEDTEFVNAISAMSGVRSAVLVSYNGDYMG